MDTDLEPNDALQVLAGALGFAVDRARDEAGHLKYSQGPGFLVVAYRAGTGTYVDPLSDIIREQVGIDPKVIFDFKELRRESPDEPHDPYLIIKGVQAVCRILSGDALLLFNGETVELLKKGGVLYVNSRIGWPDYDIFQQPYVLKELDPL